MAQFNADIRLKADARNVLKEIDKIEKRIEQVNKAGKFTFGTKTSPRQRAAERAQQKTLQTERALLEVKKRETLEETKLLKSYNTRQRRAKFIADQANKTAAAAKREAAAAKQASKARTQKIQGAVAGGVISAAFPILTGGGAAESALGGVGGLLGSLAGPLGSFAGGIGGSALGRIIQDAEDLNKQLVSLNAQFGNTGAAALLTAGDVGELAKQLNITKEDVISLAGELAAFAQLSAIEDLAKAFGPVGGAGTFDALAQAAESEAAALKAIDGLRGQIGLKTAEELLQVLKIEGSEAAQAALLDALLGKTEDITTEVAKQVTFWDRIAAAIFTAASGQFIAPEDLAGDRADGVVGPDKSVIDKALADYERYLETRRTLDAKYNPKTGRKGRTGGALPQSKELQLRQQILKTELSIEAVQTKRRALQATELGAIRMQDVALYERLNTEIEILELARQQALVSSKVPQDAILINKLYDQRLEKLKRENDLQREQNLLKGEQIKLQQALTALRNEQQTEGIVQGLERGIEDANSRSSSEMLSLRIKQLRREEDLIGGINDKLKEQGLIEAGNDAKKAAAATKEIGFLEDRKAAIEALLPALNQAEQQQLRFNQAFAAISPAVNSLVSGLQEVVAGTKTAEEAFADFLKTIADQLISTAATMIAQYIAIGIAKAFAFGGNSAASGAEGIGAAAAGGIGIPGLATGGTANGGQPYVVGEKGPELFLPGVTGTVVNNDQFEAARESMSYYGGSGGSNGGGTGTFRLETTVINGVEYATVEQVRAMGKSSAREGAAAGNAKTMNSLRNSRSQRSKIGLR